ncbi:hypothetical protein HD554DRAFT_2174094 [Boletus coccyginus]|nr:hypothetical protein HD554DRAFT_2174094 [Boletus coccyginus]
MNILAILCRGGKAAAIKFCLLGTTENQARSPPLDSVPGHEYTVRDDKDGPNRSTSEKLKVFITTPFHPGYLTTSLVNLNICITADVGSDHINLNIETIERGHWHVSGVSRDAFDLENNVVGTIGCWLHQLPSSPTFDLKELLYYDSRRVLRGPLALAVSMLLRKLFFSVMSSLSTALPKKVAVVL